MHLTAGVLTALLESDLTASGWDGSTTPDLGRTPSQYAMTSIRNSLTKKLVGNVVSKELEHITLEAFLASNAACEKYVPPPYRVSESGTWEVQDWDVLLYGEVKDLLHSFFNAPDFSDVREKPITEKPEDMTYSDFIQSQRPQVMYGGQSFPILRTNRVYLGLDVGPGASVGASETDFFTKLVTSPLTYTNDSLLYHYQQAISHDLTWMANELERHEGYGEEIVEGSRLSFVPKSTKIARTICTEPILNMMFQKGVSRILRKRLREFFRISLSDQPDWNAHLAQLGSITGGFATIDLKNASDTIALSLVKDLIDPDNFRWLDKSRSPNAVLPDGSIVQLHMISSMGNDFTFPLQTIIFTAIVHAVYRLHGLIPVGPDGRSPGNFGVFGDDIVVDSRVYEAMLSALKLFGFTPNVDKSFNTGDFRESCGHDYYQGHEVRGIYLDSLSNELDYLSAFNRLVRWSLTHVPLRNLLRAIRKGFRFLPVPPDLSDTAGIHVPQCLAPSYTRGKLGKQYAMLRLRGIWTYRYHKVVPRTRNLVPLGLQGVNPSGLLLAVKAFRLSNGRIGLRSTDIKTVTKVAVTPRWGYSHHWTKYISPEKELSWQALLLEVL